MVRQLPTVKAKLGWIMGKSPPPQPYKTIVTLAEVSPATANVSYYTTAFVRKEGTEYSYIRLKIQEVIYHLCICIFNMKEGVWKEPPLCRLSDVHLSMTVVGSTGIPLQNRMILYYRCWASLVHTLHYVSYTHLDLKII